MKKIKPNSRRTKTVSMAVNLDEYYNINKSANELEKTVSDYCLEKVLMPKTPNLFSGGGNVAETDTLKKQITTLQEQLKKTQAAPQNDGLAKEYADYKKQSQKVVEEAIRQEKDYQKQITELEAKIKELNKLAPQLKSAQEEANKLKEKISNALLLCKKNPEWHVVDGVNVKDYIKKFVAPIHSELSK